MLIPPTLMFRLSKLCFQNEDVIIQNSIVSNAADKSNSTSKVPHPLSLFLYSDGI